MYARLLSIAVVIILVVSILSGCDDLLVVKLLEDDVAPIVVITSHVDGEMYLLTDEPNQYQLHGLDWGVVITASLADTTLSGAPGIISRVRIDVIGHPEMSEYDGRSLIDSDLVDGNRLYGDDDEGQEVAFIIDPSELAGTISVRITAEDWNGNTSTAEVSLEPPNMLCDFRLESEALSASSNVRDANYHISDSESYSYANLLESDVDPRTATDLRVDVPATTDVTSLIATFGNRISTVSVDGELQESGVTENNFSSPVLYTVTANDGTVATFTVSVFEE